MDSDSGNLTSDRSVEAATPPIGKTIQDLAYEYDDFLTDCAPTGRLLNTTQSSRQSLLRDLRNEIERSVEKCKGSRLEYLEDKLKLLNDMFDFHEQGVSKSNLDQMDVNALQEESEMLEHITELLEAALVPDDKCEKVDTGAISEDFKTCSGILHDTISTVFKENASEVLSILSGLTKGAYNDEGNEQEAETYLDLSSEQHSDQVVERLVEMGIIEYNPDDDTQIKLCSLD